MLNLDLKKAQELVAEAIAEKGEDYVYEKVGAFSCLYVHGKPDIWDPEEEKYVSAPENLKTGCLVGHALKLGGVPMEVMYESINNEGGSDSMLEELRDRGFVTSTDDAKVYLANIQNAQDMGAPWGEAKKAADDGFTLEPDIDVRGNRTGKFNRIANWR